MSTVTIPAGAKGADYAYSSNKTKALFDKYGVVWVDRYVPYGNNIKGMTIAERDYLISIGMPYCLTWETNEGAILGGATQGRVDGLRALIGAQSLQYDPACAIRAAVDTDVYAANKQLCHDYLRAFYAVIYPAYGRGLYGDNDAYQQVADVCEFWKRPNAPGWSNDHNQTQPYGLNEQQGKQDLTIGWDYPNICIRPFQACTGPHADVPPAPQNPHITEDKDMFYSSEAFTFGGAVYDPKNGQNVFWRFNDDGNPVHIKTLQEVEARGGKANAQPFTNAELAGIPGLPTA